MQLEKIPPGKNPPKDVNVLIEIPMGGPPVKYEMDKESGALIVDRFLHTAMFYPCNYGFIPNTLSGDGDPVDVLVLTQVPVMSGAILRSRPVGVLVMTDNAGQDEKILAVPVDDLHPYYDNITSYKHVRHTLLDQIAHFFQHYKDLEPGKWTKLDGWHDVDVAERLILEGIARHNAKG